MVGHRVSSPHNPWIREIRRLRAGRGDRDRLLLEGPHLLSEALACGVTIERVLATAAWRDRPEAAAILSRLPQAPDEVDPDLFARIGDADTPQGILALARAPALGLAGIPLRPGGVYLYADSVQDPGNVGALARTALAAGAAALLLGAGSAHPHHPRALRASAGALLRLPVARPVAPAEGEEVLASLAPRWLLLDPHDGQPLYDADLAGTIVLAVGAEGAGLSAAVRARPGGLAVHIPLAAGVESLNVTVAAAVALFERRRRDL